MKKEKLNHVYAKNLSMVVRCPKCEHRHRIRIHNYIEVSSPAIEKSVKNGERRNQM